MTWAKLPDEPAAPKAKHGHNRGGRRTPEYRAWASMIARCKYPKRRGYKNYGGRGISVCHRWQAGDGRQSGFECFLEDVGPRPSAGHSIDRRDNNGNYEPGNVRWATKVQQSSNKRPNITVDLYGDDICLKEAVRFCGAVGYTTAQARIHRGWGGEDAVTTPAGEQPKQVGAPF